MQHAITRMKGYFFAAGGGLFTFIGLTGFLIQLVTGEAQFKVAY